MFTFSLFTIHSSLNHMIIRSLTILFFSSFFATVNAQEFMEHLTSKVAGQGNVTVLQDARLNDIVNGNKLYVAPVKEKEEKLPGVSTGKKIKARGYRIQVYWGGSTRTDQANAQRAGNRVSTLFPELQVYTSFESPNWRCRVGDFANRQEAADYLKKMKEAKLSQDAIIVKSEVLIQQP